MAIKVILLLLTLSFTGCGANQEVKESKAINSTEVIEITIDESKNEYEETETESENDSDSYRVTDLSGKEKIAFVCKKSSGDPDLEGGSSSDQYSVVIDGTNMVVYKTFIGTTADNGFTTMYNLTIDEEAEIKSYLSTSDWKSLYETIVQYVDENEGTVVSTGMNDSDSRNEDGSYKWEDDFKSLVTKEEM